MLQSGKGNAKEVKARLMRMMLMFCDGGGAGAGGDNYECGCLQYCFCSIV
jgi:hypothetical protein